MACDAIPGGVIWIEAKPKKSNRLATIINQAVTALRRNQTQILLFQVQFAVFEAASATATEYVQHLREWIATPGHEEVRPMSAFEDRQPMRGNLDFDWRTDIHVRYLDENCPICNSLEFANLRRPFFD